MSMCNFGKIVLSLCIFLVAMACDGADYRGDGTFIDHGRSAASWRYVLTLGEIKLDAESTHTYQLTGLPSEEYIVGVAIGRDGLWAETDSLSIQLRYKVIDADGTVVLESDQPFSSWTWSVPSDQEHAFVYVAGSQSKLLAVSGTMYSLKVVVQSLNNQPHSELVGKLELRAQGWK